MKSDPASLALLERIASGIERNVAAVEGLRRDLRRRLVAELLADLPAALDGFFGDAPFTSAGVIAAAEEDGRLFDVIGRLVDLDGDQPGVHLGRILADHPLIEVVGGRRGAGVYRLRR